MARPHGAALLGWDAVEPTHHVTVTTLASWLIGWLPPWPGLHPVADCRRRPARW
ncbi:MAG: hypothetical protein ACRDRU_20075 [Pseudonocardiaceae bacterium]